MMVEFGNGNGNDRVFLTPMIAVLVRETCNMSIYFVFCHKSFILLHPYPIF